MNKGLNFESSMDLVTVLDLMSSKEFIFDEPNGMDNWKQYGFVKKDVFDGDILKVVGAFADNSGNYNLKCSNGIILTNNIKKEKKFFNSIEIGCNSVEEITNWLNSECGKEYFVNNTIKVQVLKNNKNYVGSLLAACADSKREEFMEEVKNPQKVYMAKILSKNNGGFLVEVDNVEAFLPGSLASANKLTNFDVMIDKVIPVMVEDFIKEGSTFIVSNKKYIQRVLPTKIKELDLQKKYTGVITGSAKFGVFVEWDEIFTGLVHVSEMNEESKRKLEQRAFQPGDKIDFYIKEIIKNDRIILSENEPREKVDYFGEFKTEFETKFSTGLIKNIKPVGAFIEFEHKGYKLFGLLHNKEYTNGFEPEIGKNIIVYVQFVDVDSKKIYLKLSNVE